MAQLKKRVIFSWADKKAKKQGTILNINKSEALAFQSILVIF